MGAYLQDGVGVLSSKTAPKREKFHDFPCLSEHVASAARRKAEL